MANKSSIIANIASCSESLRRLRQYLENVHLYQAADDAYAAQVNLHRVRKQHDESTEQKDRIIDALRRDLVTEQTAAQNAKRLVQVMQEKLDKQAAAIAEHYRTVHELKQDLESVRSKALAECQRKYREGYTVGIATSQEKVDDQAVTIAAHASTIRDLRRDLEKIRSHGQAHSNRRYQEGYAAGFAAGQEAARPPPPPPLPRVDQETRMAWMARLLLSSNTRPHLSSNLKQAIVNGNRDVVASILNTQSADVAPPALHLAALFGDIEIARLLLAYGMDVNGQCIASSEKSGGHVYGVTPMHLAIGAQHEDMIKLLRRNGASFEARSAAEGTRTSAPPLWLISSRWLSMSGKDRPDSVVRILRLLQALGWDTEAGLNKDGDTMERLVRKGCLGERSDMKRAVLRFLQE